MSDKLDNFVGKGENAGYLKFSLFLTLFLRAFLPKNIKSRDCVVMGEELHAVDQLRNACCFPGTILVPIFGVENVDFRIEVHSPPELRSYLEEYFNITQSTSSYMFQVAKYIDIEDLYLKAVGNNNKKYSPFSDFFLIL